MSEKQLTKFVKASIDYWEGAFSFIDDSMPDGAWLQMHIDTVEAGLDDCCSNLGLQKPRDVDAHDIVMTFIHLTAKHN